MRLTELHATVADFEVRDHSLCIGGLTVREIAAKLGSTPFYAYDSTLLVGRLKELRDALPNGIRLHYAIKANPMADVVNLVSSHVDGLDVASSGELDIALASGIDASEISMAGPGKSDADLRAAVASGIVINIESAFELDRIEQLVSDNGKTPKISIRVNPGFELKSSGMQMSGGAKQFGIDDDLVPGVLTSLADRNVEFSGFHIFSGSQSLSEQAICEAHSQAVELAIHLARYAPCGPRVLNVGGGFGVPYFPGDRPLDLRPICENLRRLRERTQTELPEAALTLELGRYIVAEAGVYVCKVIDRKISRGRTFLVTNGGLHHHLAATGNFGQIIRKNYPVAVANRIDSDESEIASVVGPLCTPLDLLADRMRLAKAQVGDLIAVFQSGAYGFTASPHGFLSHPAPREILL